MWIDADSIEALREREAALKRDIAMAREKEQRLRASISTREQTLNRLQAKIAMTGGRGAGPCDDE